MAAAQPSRKGEASGARGLGGAGGRLRGRRRPGAGGLLLPGRQPLIPIYRIPLPPRRLPPIDIVRGSEDLRVDVDGWYPQNVISGTIRRGLVRRLDWHARVVATAVGTWSGGIVYRDGDTSLLPQMTRRRASSCRTSWPHGGVLPAVLAELPGGSTRARSRR